MYLLIMQFYINVFVFSFFYYFDFITHNYNFFVIVKKTVSWYCDISHSDYIS